MKKIFLLLLGFILGALATYFYCCSSDEDATVMYAAETPKGIITPARAKVLDATFNSRHKLISDSIVTRDGGDNRSSWFSLQEMNNYLNYAKNQADTLKYNMDGIRVYLGAYPEVKGVEGYTTVFFVPTGTPKKSKGNMFSLYYQPGTSSDIPGANGLNDGPVGDPPSSNYPQ